MSNGPTRLQNRFLMDPEHAERLAQEQPELPAVVADEQGLATFLLDPIDWEDDVLQTRYGLENLRHCAYDAIARQRRKHRPRLWDRDAAGEIPVFKFGQLQDAGSSLELMLAVRDFGIARVLARISHHSSRQLLLHCSTSCIPAVVLRRRYAALCLTLARSERST